MAGHIVAMAGGGFISGTPAPRSTRPSRGPIASPRTSASPACPSSLTGTRRLDAAPTLVAAPRGADPEGSYVVGTDEALPFGDGVFDLVVAYNSLMDVEDVPRDVAEAAGAR